MFKTVSRSGYSVFACSQRRRPLVFELADEVGSAGRRCRRVVVSQPVVSGTA